MKKSILIVLFTFLSLPFLHAQDEDQVKACLNNYLDGITKGNTELLSKAFHSSAMLRTINASTGKLLEFPVATFISKTPAGGVQAKGKIISYSIIGQAAVASIELSFADFKYVDYLSMLKFGEDWKIVCRVFSKADLAATATNFGGGSTGSTAATKKAPKVKPKSDDGW
jgi:hypothetical protein